MPIREDAWLAGRLGCAVYTVEPGTEAGEVATHAGERPALYQAKVTAEDVAAVRELATVGFYSVDVNVTLAREPDASAAPQRYAVVHGRPEHRDAVLAIAGSCFRYSRFHLDPAISQEAADRVKRDWAASYFDGARGDHVLVALDGGDPVGFLAVLARKDGARDVRVIDLVGVATAAQGAGVGRDLTAAFLAEAATAAAVEVGTQAANLPATRMYERMGFAVARTTWVLHRHVDRG